MRNIIEEIKAWVNCKDLAQALGLQLNSSGMTRCPAPDHEDRNPSCKVYDDGFFCFSCGLRGSAIDLVMIVKNLGFIDAARWLADWLGLPWPERSEDARQEYEKQINRQQEIEKRLTAWSKNLRPKDIEYFKGRGFTEEFIKEHGFGYCNQKMPQDPAAARDLGLLIDTKAGKEWYMPNGRLVLPFYQYGKVVQVAFHKPGDEPKYLYPKSWPKPLIKAFKRNEIPFLIEGVFCYYSLLQADLPAMTALGIAVSKEQKKELAELPLFYICFDNDVKENGDNPGQKAALGLAKEFFPAAKIINLPNGKDINDLLQELRQDEFKEYMLQAAKNAINYLDIMMEKLETNPQDEEARKEAMLFTAKLSSSIDRDLRIDWLAKILKPLGIGKTAIRAEVERLKKELAAQEEGSDKEDETQADLLIKIATANAFLFHDETKDGFAQIEINGHKETHSLQSKFFRQWLIRKYYEQTERSPNSEAVRQALGLIEAKAVFDGPEHKLHLRIAEHDGAIYYDLANDNWQAVKVTADGWQVINDPPILFRRFKNTAAQVLPEPGGSLELLRKYINFKSEGSWLLSDACDASFLIPGVPHVINIFHGDKGSAKTTAQRVKRRLIDPAHRDTMTLPADKNELALMLMTNYAPCFDNLDGLQPWQSDMLCQAVTGGGISKRELYTDIDEVILSFLRCPMLNGINLVASRDDLLDRSVLFQLERIDEDDRKEEKVFWEEFEKDRPYILGALFDSVSAAMRIYPTLRLDRLPRMADFARWGYAITEATGKSGEQFLAAYYRNIKGAVEEAVLGDQVGAAVVDFMNEREYWDGTATELLKLLSELPGIDVKSKYWPKRPHTLTRRLNKIKSALADYGITVEPWRKGSTRGVSLRKKTIASLASQASQAREHRHSNSDAIKMKASLKSDSVTIASLSDAIETKASPHEPREHRHCDGNDASDALLSTSGEGAEEDILSRGAF